MMLKTKWREKKSPNPILGGTMDYQFQGPENP